MLTNSSAEHATDPPSTSTKRPRRPDFSTVYSNLAQITPSSPTADHLPREGAVPTPAEVSAFFRNLIGGYQAMISDDEEGQELLIQMIDNLRPDMETPPPKVQGVSDVYVHDLDQVDIKQVPEDADCPICKIPFAKDPYPLLVRLPCHKDHIFDLGCVRPWLLSKGTCPLDRVDFGQQERDRKKNILEEIRKAEEANEEEEWDGMYG